MKKIIFAALLICATGASFGQAQIGNNHGEDLCMCRGIGIQVFRTGDGEHPVSVTAPGAGIVVKKETDSQNIWYAFIQTYLIQMRNAIQQKEGNK